MDKVKGFILEYKIEFGRELIDYECQTAIDKVDSRICIVKVVQGFGILTSGKSIFHGSYHLVCSGCLLARLNLPVVNASNVTGRHLETLRERWI